MKVRQMRFLTVTSLVALAMASAVAAQPADEPGKAGKSGKSIEALHKEALAEETEAAWARAPLEEREVVTRHSVNVDGRKLNYAATAGTLTIRDAVGEPEASIFYTAYTLDGTKPGTKRPIMFFFNGGPGSASLWLHMGSFAPVRLTTGNPEYIRPAPFDFGPNPDTLLGTADLVFIDAPGAGYSRPLGDAKPSDFYGVDQDVDAFSRAILRYVTKFGRWNSPKFILGESYGTTRAGALSNELQERGMALNGVVLLSSIMNYGVRQPGFDQVYLTYLPSYAATAWYHNRLPNRPASVEEAVAAAREFAQGPYTAALAKGQTISPEERDAVAERMSQLIGLSPDFIKQANLRIDLSRFRKELLRDQRITVGRFDSRYTGVDSDAAGDGPEFDASSEAISGAFIGSLKGYLTHELGYETDMTYRLSARDAPGFEWDWSHEAPGSRREQTTPNTAVDLSVAMRTNPYLKVLSLNGYYDMATPFYGTEYDLRHMMLEPAQQQNLEFRYYPAGHMTYLNPDALRQMNEDLAGFINEAVADARSGTPGN